MWRDFINKILLLYYFYYASDGSGNRREPGKEVVHGLYIEIDEGILSPINHSLELKCYIPDNCQFSSLSLASVSWCAFNFRSFAMITQQEIYYCVC